MWRQETVRKSLINEYLACGKNENNCVHNDSNICDCNNVNNINDSNDEKYE